MPDKKKSQYQQNLVAESAGANQSGGNPADFLSKIARGFVNAGGADPKAAPQPTNIGDPSLLSYEQQAASNPHVMKMQEAASAAKLKYMQENGVDENGDPIKK